MQSFHRDPYWRVAEPRATSAIDLGWEALTPDDPPMIYGACAEQVYEGGPLRNEAGARSRNCSNKKDRIIQIIYLAEERVRICRVWRASLLMTHGIKLVL